LVSRLRRADPEMLIGTYSGQGGQYWDGKAGRMVGVERDEIKHRFLRGEVDILVCTDAAAEGLNLQTADLLVNFDLPWNPMKVEQRIGRIDRIGQRYRDIYVLNLCYADSAEEVVYGRLLTRLHDAGIIVGTQQMSLLPVTPEEFAQLADKTLNPEALEREAIKRAKAARQRTASMETTPELDFCPSARPGIGR
jgi:superfamily II DNA/RNA helicase